MSFIKLKLPPEYKKGLKEKGDAYFGRGEGLGGDWMGELFIISFLVILLKNIIRFVIQDI